MVNSHDAASHGSDTNSLIQVSCRHRQQVILSDVILSEKASREVYAQHRSLFNELLKGKIKQLIAYI